MAELILTPEEKAADSCLEWTDEALAKAVRYTAVMLRNNAKGNYSVIANGALAVLSGIAEELGPSEQWRFHFDTASYEVIVRRTITGVQPMGSPTA